MWCYPKPKDRFPTQSEFTLTTEQLYQEFKQQK
jgi:hypothetical protein